jgi:hypothetical protein
LPIDVGTPTSIPPPDAGSSFVPTFTMPTTGYVAGGIPVTLGAPLPLPRPYFYPDGADTADPNLGPVVTMTQDHHVLAQPADPVPTLVQQFQASFKALRIDWGVPQAELASATDPGGPFHLQIDPAPRGGLNVWTAGPSIPETTGQNPAVASLWPLIVLAKLDTDLDPNGTTPQGSATKPIVVIQAITLWKDDLLANALEPPGREPAPENVVDRVTALVRPSAICFDPRSIEKGGTLVTPYFTGKSPETPDGPEVPLFDPNVLRAVQAKQIRNIRRGCLPAGKYGINLVYPSGQAWTVPNEMGACAPAEGTWDTGVNPSSCAAKPRAVLRSQGPRAVLEIVAPTTPDGQKLCATDAPVPPECLANP